MKERGYFDGMAHPRMILEPGRRRTGLVRVLLLRALVLSAMSFLLGLAVGKSVWG